MTACPFVVMAGLDPPARAEASWMRPSSYGFVVGATEAELRGRVERGQVGVWASYASIAERTDIEAGCGSPPTVSRSGSQANSAPGELARRGPLFLFGGFKIAD